MTLPLSPREREVLAFAAIGLSRKAIASRLGISEATVKQHRKTATCKLAATTTTQAVAIAVRRDLI